LQHLLTCSQRTNITVQVVPFSAGATPGLEGPYIILDLGDSRSVVHVESRRASAFLSEESHVRATKLATRHLIALALAPDESRRLIADVASETRSSR
jgi:hypothetical protein